MPPEATAETAQSDRLASARCRALAAAQRLTEAAAAVETTIARGLTPTAGGSQPWTPPSPR